MTIEEMRQRKKELGYNYGKIAELSGLPISTVQKILGGVTKAPRYQSLQALERVLKPELSLPAYPASGSAADQQEKSTGSYFYQQKPVPGTGMVREENAVYHATPHLTMPASSGSGESGYGAGEHHYVSAASLAEIAYMRTLTQDPKQGTYTADDREKLPDERRTELIDGVIYDMASPGWQHQTIASKIYQMIQTQIEEEDCHCLSFLAPLDVALDRDQWTRVQPDFFVLCHPVSGNGNYIEGAPELIVEILSPSTKRKDQKVKSRKYADAGVLEYWMVDPEQETITILYLNDRRDEGPWEMDHPCAAIYGFHDKVPVGICKEGFQLDFAAIADTLKRTEEWGLIPPSRPYLVTTKTQDKKDGM